MFIFKNQFKNVEEANKFWNSSAFDLLDLNFALADSGLTAQAVELALHFAEPDLMAIYGCYMLDFEFMKNALGVPSVYVSREEEFSSEMAQPQRDASQLKYSKEEMKKRFEKLMQILKEEFEKSVKKLQAQGRELIDSGVLKTQQMGKFEPTFDVIKETIKNFSNKDE